MATIVSGASSDVLTIDPTSKAARATLYNSAGTELIVAPTGSYGTNISVRQTGTTAANAVVWSMRNGGTKTVQIRRIKVVRCFDGTAAATTTARYTIQRFTAATPTGGNAQLIGKKRTSYPTSTVVDVRSLDTGLTTTSVVFDNIDLAILALPLSVTGTVAPDDIVFEGVLENFAWLELAANEGLCIRLNQTAVIGQGIYGGIFWDER